jgi:uncharacterized protein (DUF1697 family)
MTTYVSLFRAINVGDRQVSMNELKALHESLGFKHVAHYLRTGNIVFTSDDTDVARLARQIEDGFARQFSFQTNVMLRTSGELEEIVANNPFRDQPAKEAKWIVVMFLTTRPEPAALQELQKTYTGPEEMYLIGQDLYLYYTTGIGRSKLTNTLIEKKLKTMGTGRNWNTVLQLQQMMQL